MRFRDTIKDGLFEFQHLYNFYRLNLQGHSLREDLIRKFILNTLIILYPIVPHFSEILYKNYYVPKNVDSIRDIRWPEK